MLKQTTCTPTITPANSSKINRDNSYFSFISGAIYISPTMPFVYEGHPDEDGNTIDLTPESKFSKIKNESKSQEHPTITRLIRWIDSGL